jgi:hypothetical protein
MTNKVQIRTRVRGPKKAPEQFEDQYAELLKKLYKEAKFKGRPPENSSVLLGKLKQIGHFPWLNKSPSNWATSLIDGGPAYQQHLDDRLEEITKARLNNLASASITPGKTKSDAGRQSGINRRATAQTAADLIAKEYQQATKTLGAKPDAFVVAKWKIQQIAPDLNESEKKRQIRNLTKQLRELNSAI